MEKEDIIEIKGEEYNIKVLDSIDFLPYIKKFKGDTVGSLIDAVEEDFDGTEITNNDYLMGYIFNWFGMHDIVQYLTRRYPNDFNTIEVTDYHIL